jgi:flagellar basal-body rod protein FlgF
MSDFSAAALSRQSGLMRELNVIANNIANASTAGFKREASVFSEYVVKRDGPSVSMGALRGHYAVLDEGAYVRTDGTFDIAIGGEGFFAVETEGSVFLTRGGQFQLDGEGRLVTPEGYAVLDEAGGTIEIPAEAVDITVSPDGVISADGLALAQLGVFSAPGDSLQRRGNNLWEPTESYSFVDAPIVRQGFIEQSNVNPVLEMARLIEAQRLFEAGQNLLEESGKRRSEMIQSLGRPA